MTSTEPIESPVLPARSAMTSHCREKRHQTCKDMELVCACLCHNTKKKGVDVAKPATAQLTEKLAKSKPAGPDPAPRVPVSLVRAAKTATKAPHIERVKADPPVREKPPARRSLAELLRPILEEIAVEADRDWNRLVIFHKPTQAAMNLHGLKKTHGQVMWEWRSARLDETGQSAIYVRLIGEETPEP